jgi:flagellar basal body-associated protein FliL
MELLILILIILVILALSLSCVSFWMTIKMMREISVLKANITSLMATLVKLEARTTESTKITETIGEMILEDLVKKGLVRRE